MQMTLFPERPVLACPSITNWAVLRSFGCLSSCKLTICLESERDPRAVIEIAPVCGNMRPVSGNMRPDCAFGFCPIPPGNLKTLEILKNSSSLSCCLLGRGQLQQLLAELIRGPWRQRVSLLVVLETVGVGGSGGGGGGAGGGGGGVAGGCGGWGGGGGRGGGGGVGGAGGRPWICFLAY